jgi:signal peptidase I
MTTAQIIFSIYIYSLLAVYMVTFYKLFPKAGRKQWEGLVPVYNVYIWLKIMKKPWWWMLLMLMDGVNFLVMLMMNVELGRTYNKHKPLDILLFLILPHYAIIKLTYLENAEYTGATDWANDEHRKKREAGDHFILAFSTLGAGHVVTFVFRLLGSKNKKGRKTMVKEWSDAFLFALIAASLIRTLVIEAFNIPSPSMEKELLVGDYLFVSKMSYGPKLPNTPIAIPFVHNTIPIINTKIYVEWQKRPYRRLPGFGSVERNDIVVFNFPAGDTAINDPGTTGLMGHDYYAQLRTRAFNLFLKDRTQGKFPSGVKSAMKEFASVESQYFSKARKLYMDQYGLLARPVDKRENYIKRCVAIPGDSLEIIGGELFINGKPAEKLENIQYRYEVRVKEDMTVEQFLSHIQQLQQVSKERFDINPIDIRPLDRENRIFSIHLTPQNFKKFISHYGEENVLRQDLPKGYYVYANADSTRTDEWNMIRNSIQATNVYTVTDREQALFPYLSIYPNHQSFDWTEDNFGPIYIPKAGDKLDLTKAKNVILYRKVIEHYEHHSIEMKDGKVLIDGTEQTEYEFEMDYFWLMGDNRHQSADSRFWGFVPDDHVVGKAVFIWMSRDDDGSIRWNRVFKSI